MRATMKIGMVTDSLGALSLRGRARRGGGPRPRLRRVRHRQLVDGAAYRHRRAPEEQAGARQVHRRGRASAGCRSARSPATATRCIPARAAASTTRSSARPIELAPLIGVDRVVLMSGCPGAQGRQAPELDHGRLAAGDDRNPRMAMERGADPLLARPRRLRHGRRASATSASNCTAGRTSTTSPR